MAVTLRYLLALYHVSHVDRPAVTDGFHFTDDLLSCLHSFPLDQVNTLRRPSCKPSESTLSTAVSDTDNSAAGKSADDLLPVVSSNVTDDQQIVQSTDTHEKQV